MSHETKQGATDQDQVQVTWAANGWRERVALRARREWLSSFNTELPPPGHVLTAQDTTWRQW